MLYTSHQVQRINESGRKGVRTRRRTLWSGEKRWRSGGIEGVFHFLLTSCFLIGNLFVIIQNIKANGIVWRGKRWITAREMCGVQ